VTAVTPRPRKGGIFPTSREALAAFASGTLFAFAFPPFNLVFPVFLCLVPVTATIAWYADREGHAWNAARAGFWFGVVGYGVNLYWIAVALLLYTKLALLGYLGTLVWLAPVVGATAAALFVARRLTGWPFAILLPVIWTASELVLNYLNDLSFPWLPLGLGVAHVPVLAQAAELSGVRGLTFCIAAVNGFIVDAWLWRHERTAIVKRIAGAGAVVLAMLAYGAWRMSFITLTPLTQIAVVQPDIPEEAKLTIRDPTTHVAILTRMTRDVLSRGAPQLVVWPEAALDQFLWRYPNWRDSLQSAVRGRPTPILTGVMDSDNPMVQPFRYYNAAILTTPEGFVSRQSVYRKEFLVPIVERVPFLNPEWFRGMNYFGGFSHGQGAAPFPISFGKVGVMICYESIFPQLARSYARQGATVLANITNDAWFQRSSAPYQHFAHLSLRAIETRLPIVRAANTGISGYIDPLGRVRDATPIFVPRTAVYTVESAHIATPYVLLGDWVGALCFTATITLLMASRWRGRAKAQTI
jgi:apolipoprotein N-acyltransferase